MGKINNFMSNKDIEKYVEEMYNHKYTCQCGHRVYIAHNKEKALRNWCGKYVFKNKKDEFEYRINERLRNDKWKKQTLIKVQ